MAHAVHTAGVLDGGTGWSQEKWLMKGGSAALAHRSLPIRSLGPQTKHSESLLLDSERSLACGYRSRSSGNLAVERAQSRGRELMGPGRCYGVTGRVTCYSVTAMPGGCVMCYSHVPRGCVMCYSHAEAVLCVIAVAERNFKPLEPLLGKKNRALRAPTPLGRRDQAARQSLNVLTSHP